MLLIHGSMLKIEGGDLFSLPTGNLFKSIYSKGQNKACCIHSPSIIVQQKCPLGGAKAVPIAYVND